MMELDIREELQAIFRRLFDDEAVEITENTQPKDIQGWDSLMHVRIITAAEKHFKIKFSMADVRTFSDVGSILKKISEKMV